MYHEVSFEKAKHIPLESSPLFWDHAFFFLEREVKMPLKNKMIVYVDGNFSVNFFPLPAKASH